MATFHLTSLGCAKNLVDSEIIIGSMLAAGFTLSQSMESGDYLLINTCGFIQEAVEEAIEEILLLATEKKRDPQKKLVVIGCLVQRYQAELLPELEEVDLFVGTESAAHLGALLHAHDWGDNDRRLYLAPRTSLTTGAPRILTTPPFRSWMKITEGCDNRCSYCMIPFIRGGLRSRSVADLVEEAQRLEKQGVKELSIIGQDITAFGRDRGEHMALPGLLTALLRETTIPWIRLLYLYPTGIDDKLIKVMAENPRILPYLDLPLQHVSERVLRAMNRHYRADTIHQIIDRLRHRLEDIALRTTFLVGFPGESEEDFNELEQFMIATGFDHVGVFAYANEEGAPSAGYKAQVPPAERLRRRDHLLDIQAAISARRQQRFVGTLQPVLVEGLSAETDLLLEGRSRFQAPEVDGCVYINDGVANAGDIVTVRISEAQVYDLVGAIETHGI